MTGKPRKPSEGPPTETSQPKQQVQDDGSDEGAENFGNINTETTQFGNIDPD